MRFAAPAVFLALLFAGFPAVACSLLTASKFVPDEDRYVIHYEGENPQRLPRPTLTLDYVRRGTAEPGFSCDDAGTLQVSVSLPDSSLFALAELGFYFRVVSGSDPYSIIPAVPVTGIILDNAMLIILAWLDGHPRSQQPIELEIEAFAVAHDLSIGPPTRLTIQAPIGPASISP